MTYAIYIIIQAPNKLFKAFNRLFDIVWL